MYTENRQQQENVTTGSPFAADALQTVGAEVYSYKTSSFTSNPPTIQPNQHKRNDLSSFHLHEYTSYTHTYVLLSR